MEGCRLPLLTLSALLLLMASSSCNVYKRQLLSAAEPLQSAGRASPAPKPAPDPAPDAGRAPAETRCGDGIITGVEKCDTAIEAGQPGACPRDCPELAPCAQRALNGSACQAECVLIELSCGARDGCCPSACAPATDVDCSTSCGDGAIDGARGETCEPKSSTPCPADAAACADSDACTRDALTGSAANCNAVCTHEPISARTGGDGCCPDGADSTQDSDCPARCGNGVLEAGEACDGGDRCSATCSVIPPSDEQRCQDDFATTDCQRCSCSKCNDTYLGCVDVGDTTNSRSCRAVVECAERSHCSGDACYCGISPCVPPGIGPGACRTEIEDAAGTIDPLLVLMQSRDPSSTLGRANALGACRQKQCASECYKSALR
jgi:hypothetical protein